MTTTKTLKKYEALIDKGLFTEQELISFRKMINDPRNADNVEVQDLLSEFEWKAEHKGIKLTLKQQVRGILWLHNATFKKNGQPRKNAPLGHFEQHVLRNFKEFRCVGLFELGSFAKIPVYRCIATDGSYFEYACKMWGEIIITAIHKEDGPVVYHNSPDFNKARRPLKLVA